jgi:hypothetical protein
MAYYTIPGFEAKVFAPETNHCEGRKYNCADCFSCQMCSDERCNTCINKVNCRKKMHPDLEESAGL